jgi:hypothetical protein
MGNFQLLLQPALAFGLAFGKRSFVEMAKEGFVGYTVSLILGCLSVPFPFPSMDGILPCTNRRKIVN